MSTTTAEPDADRIAASNVMAAAVARPDLTIDDIADRADLDAVQLAAWLTREDRGPWSPRARLLSKRVINIEELRRLALALDVDLGDLLEA